MRKQLKGISLQEAVIAGGAVILLVSIIPMWENFSSLRWPEFCPYRFDHSLLVLPAGAILFLLVAARLGGTWEEVSRPLIALFAFASLGMVLFSSLYRGRSTWDIYNECYWSVGRKGVFLLVVILFLLEILLSFRWFRACRGVLEKINDCVMLIPTAAVLLCLWPSGPGPVLAIIGAIHAARASLVCLYTPRFVVRASEK